MVDPVTCTSDGLNYDRSAIIAWFQKNHTSPITHKILSNKGLKANHALRQVIQKFREHHLAERIGILQLQGK